MEKTIRKTTKFFKERLANCDASVIAEVIKLYGRNNQFYLRNETEFHWNHRISRFRINDKKQISIEIYWQGDSTDGTESVLLPRALNGVTIPAEHFYDCGRTYCRHSDITIKRDEVLDAMKIMGNLISDELKKEIKAEKDIERKIKKLTKRVQPFLEAYKAQREKERKNGYRDLADKTFFGISGVEKAIVEKHDDLLALNDEQLEKAIRYIFNANRKDMSRYPYAYCLDFPK